MATPTELLNCALLAMAELHDSMTPDEREENAILPAAAVRKFVDSHARLMFERERMVDLGAVIKIAEAELGSYRDSYTGQFGDELLRKLLKSAPNV